MVQKVPFLVAATPWSESAYLLFLLRPRLGGVTIDEFVGMLDAYLRWHRDVRVKSDLGYRSPAQYRRDLGMAM